ncbi:MAG: hypothetical protein A2X54_06065 [Nitrospirae bacterium GWF2_44_13]|nr:MAG: hypothetical protein A2X54_06065 [Nitrospirae bacterium GWF2_44_13]OGW66260.1 MAG: hypothetical protein A2222_07750 [Nitrospirae bacterium RIFOXYA2_FULL_44_9]OGW74458.1 MAG: hypothetical protein A2484_07710 [Nitrospirae bacterium RIFOXYC2_FULL_44_7]HBG93662.1 hypothetical protein [Nitrospiraceae bacterium]
MNNRLNDILEEIRELEHSVQEEMKRREEELKYKVTKGKVIFEKEIAEIHKKLSTSLFLYFIRSSFLTAVSTPVIYLMIIPAVILDLSLWIYQAICFPVYKIPKVIRSDHIILDRHYLKYLNFMEKLGCDYCSYYNGLVSYATEIAARTEQYWCPIKHASGNARRHSRYHLFTDYGDAEAYRSKLAGLREKYDDVR